MKKLPGLIIAGAAAYIYYKYSKMSAGEKKEVISNIKQKGKQLFDQCIPNTLKQKLEKIS